jgi:hypothetical protein
VSPILLNWYSTFVVVTDGVGSSARPVASETWLSLCRSNEPVLDHDESVRSHDVCLAGAPNDARPALYRQERASIEHVKSIYESAVHPRHREPHGGNRRLVQVRLQVRQPKNLTIE